LLSVALMPSRSFLFFRRAQSAPKYFPNGRRSTRHSILKSKFVNSGEFVR
jgi:hypothetical protein